ncbi:MAG: amidase [Candidatus Spechtbacteria bacterium]|nr:amidase [Candidatus Spechtbacteria bacterium]
MNTLFFDYSIGEIVKKTQNKELKPDEVLAAALHNIKELDPKYFAWVVYGNEHIFAKMLERQDEICGSNPRLLDNIPVGVKDIFNTSDFPTQMGSPLWKNFTPGNDARAVFNLKRRGAVILGKTITAEFAVHALNETLNPYDPTKTPGTSSSGSAVATALGMVPMAIGTQSAGSIIRPASFCGVYGCKPSFGLIPRTGVLKTTDTLDTIGFFAIHLKDLRRIFDSLRVWGENYPISNTAINDSLRQQKPGGRPWQVGFVRTYIWKNAPLYAQEALEKFMQKLTAKNDIEIKEAALPEAMRQAHAAHETIYNKALSYYFEREYRQTDFVSKIMNELIQKGREIGVEEYKRALALQSELIFKMDSFFRDFDVIISLSTAGEAPLREVTELPDAALMWTLTHLPVVNVPLFKTASGMPFGMQIAARKYNDYLLFEFLDYLQAQGLIPAKCTPPWG